MNHYTQSLLLSILWLTRNANNTVTAASHEGYVTGMLTALQLERIITVDEFERLHELARSAGREAMKNVKDPACQSR